MDALNIRDTRWRNLMKALVFLLSIIALQLVIDIDAMAQKQCLTATYGELVCPKDFGGGIATTRSGEIVCGPGACISSGGVYGQVYCSSIKGGGVARGGYLDHEVICEGGCIEGSASYCSVTR
jgi:hypothetical protein